MLKSIENALKGTNAFTDDDMTLLRIAEGDRGDMGNWSLGAFQEVFGEDVAKAIVAHTAVTAAKAPVAEDAVQRTVLPEFPPYLDRDQKTGEPVGYDPHNPGQFWTDPDTGEMWRWDGKGRDWKQGQKNSLGQPVPRPVWPYGEPHRVVAVKHVTVDGVRVPDMQEAHDANSTERDWFHMGYNVWIGKGGKPYGDVDPEVRRRVLSAQERMPREAPLIRRPVRAA